MDIRAVRDYLDAKTDAMVASLAELVNHESPTSDKPRLDALARLLAERWRRLGADVTPVPATQGGNDRGDHLLVRLSASGRRDQLGRDRSGRRPALIVGHYDTVWPVGTLSRIPFSVDAGRATGPGVYDMKGGLVIAEYAVHALQALDIDLPRPLVVVLNSDEEIGSGTSRALIEAEAKRAAYVLVMEPALSNGAVKTARKGVGHFSLEITGVASHAGGAPLEGVSAIEELAQQVLRLHSFNDYEAGTTVNVGVVKGGSRTNVVAAGARAEIDTRAWTKDEADRLQARILSLTPFDPKAAVRIRGGFGRPPMERTAATAALFETARRIGVRMGTTLAEASSGGGSDGNFTSALGIPTLDGLGAVGDGAHAEHEYVEVASLPERAAIVAGLLCEVETLPRG